MKKTAVVSTCGNYRYRLTRTWGPGPYLAWVCLNPSTADAEHDDPTLRRIMGFSRGFGYGGCVVGNLYAFRTKSPDVLHAEWKANKAVVGTDNANYLLELIADAPLVVLGWGKALPKAVPNAPGWPETVMRMGADFKTPMRHLGVNADGSPKHPLYLSGATQLGVFPVGHPLRPSWETL